MSEEKKGDLDEDLMADFKDLFPDEDEQDSDNADNKNDDTDAVEPDEIDALLDDFEHSFDDGELAEAMDAAEGTDSADNEDKPITAQDSSDEVAEAPLLDEQITEHQAAEISVEENEVAPSSGEGELPDEEEGSTVGNDTGSVEGEQRDFELDQADLDLAVDGGEELTETLQEGDASAPSEEAGEMASQEDDDSALQADTHEGLDEVAAIAAGGSAAAAGVAQAPKQAPALRGKLVWGLAALVLVAVLLSSVSLWFVLNQGNGMAAPAAMSSGNGSDSRAAITAVRTELRTLAARVNELAVIIEGPMSHLRATTEGDLADIEQRLSGLEQRLGSASSLPQASPAPAVRAATQEKSKAEPVSEADERGGWAINLVSLHSEKDADAELKRLRQLGIEAQKQQSQRDGERWFRLRVGGFASYDEAKSHIAALEKQAGVKGAWVAQE